MTDVPFGVLLSGGLDSSLVASVTKRHLVETEAAEKFGTELHSFVVGLEVSFARSTSTQQFSVYVSFSVPTLKL
jgi:asparagine synthetase B (glutamine-hydrolysing)